MALSTSTRRLVVGGTALAVVFAGALGTAGVANAADSTSTPSASSSAAAAQARTEVRAVLHALPTSLRKDLRAAEHQKTKDARHDAVAKIESKALDGGYGSTVKTIATDVKADWSSVPKGTQKRLTAFADGRRVEALREARGMLHRALVGKDGATLQKQLQTLASGLPAAPAKTAKPKAGSDSSGS